MNRLYSQKILQNLSFFPCVAILGPRQCGKTTLAKQIAKNWKCFDLENMADRELIERDPDLFLALNHNRIFIDEAQELPQLFKALRVAIDADRQQKGRFLLTGSSSPELVRNLSESLAGRIGIVELSPFLFSESRKNFNRNFAEILSEGGGLEELERDLQTKGNLLQLHDYWFRGGYPEPWMKNNQAFRKAWLENYFATYLARDVARLFPRLDSNRFRRFIGLLAGVSGTILNLSDLARALESSQKSIRDYLQIADGTFLWRTMPAWSPRSLKRLVKHPKGHLRDSGLLHYLLRLRNLDELMLHPAMGRSWESMVIEQILRGFEARGEKINFYHYRTNGGAEVDLVLEGSFGLVPVEIKHSQVVKTNQLKSLSAFINDYSASFGIVIHNDRQLTRISEKILGIPAAFL